MLALHLDPLFKPTSLAEIAFEQFVFSGGELHIRIQSTIDVEKQVLVTTRIRKFEDLGFLCLTIDALRRMGVKRIAGCIPYVPAARQDRVMVPGEPLTISVIAQIINSLQLEKVFIFDPHSDVTPALINNVVVISNYEFVKTVMEDINNPNIVLVAPDGGAVKKIYKLSEQLGGIPVIECSKVRDVKTGKITSFSVYADNLNGVHALIVDDICDGGGTFLGLAQALLNKGIAKQYMAVSHGIFSKGIAVVQPYFEKIYVSNAFSTLAMSSVHQIAIELTLDKWK